METRRNTENGEVEEEGPQSSLHSFPASAANSSCSLSLDGLEEELDALERVICGQEKPDSIDFRLLQKLTGNFSSDRMIGEGGCGVVYKGVLPNGKVIAVKKLKNSHTIDEKMFRCEVDSMIKVGHQNIVRFMGYCSETKEKAVPMDGRTVMAEDRKRLLCFEYIRKGDLKSYLTDELRGFGWRTRYQVIRGICNGLLHLHKEKRILHMDLKPANILLDDQMVPKITDFGLSRIDEKSQTTSAQVLLSLGYCAPEYIANGKRSWKSDIYSLGVIILELVTGSRHIPCTTKVLRKWRHRWNKSSKHIPLLYQQVKKCLKLAVSCMEKNPINRPFIWDVVHELKKLDSWDGQIGDSSLEKIISSSDDMLDIEPLELHLPLAHKKQLSCSIKLTNNADYYLAFRIATASLLPFSIQPNKGIAAPRSNCRATITLSAQEMIQLHHDCKEELTVQSTRVYASITAVDVTDDMFNDEEGNSQTKTDEVDKVIDEVNLTVVFDDIPQLHEEHQKDLANLSVEMQSPAISSQEVKRSMESTVHHHPEDSRAMECILDRSERPRWFPLTFLQDITQNFSDERMIGRGRSCVVYQGILDNRIVVIKSLLNSHTISDKMFHREVITMMMVEHQNLLRFIGYCSHTEERVIKVEGKLIMAEDRKRLLCFEYISNGSLMQHLTDELRGHEWHKRYQIILGICEGLLYLHKEKHIIHMDLKPSNILIGDHMVPKIADFGLSRLGDASTTMGDHIESSGYCAPEYLHYGNMSAKSDIYSLGVVIIELVTGSKKRPNINNVLRRWRHRWNKSARYTPLWHHQVTICLELALRCTDMKPIQRPNIWDITSELNESDQKNSCLDDMLGVEPLELHFPVELNRQQSRSIQLTNDTDHYIAFMIEKSSDFACSTQPDKEVVPPRSMYSITITLQAPEEPGTGIGHWQEEITVLSTRVDGDVTAADISQDLFNEEEDKVVDEVNVKVILDTP